MKCFEKWICLFSCARVHIFMGFSAPYTCRYPWLPEGIRSPRNGVTEGCETPSVDAGNGTQNLHKNSKGFNHDAISLAHDKQFLHVSPKFSSVVYHSSILGYPQIIFYFKTSSGRVSRGFCSSKIWGFHTGEKRL